MAIKAIADDFPGEFKQEKIMALTNAFDAQIQELYQLFNSLRSTRRIGGASGASLDRLGAVVGLTRKQAAEITEGILTEYPISDVNYRRLLLMKIIKNTSNGNMDDFMQVLKYWDSKLSVMDVSDASITISEAINREMILAPAGVNVVAEDTAEAFATDSWDTIHKRITAGIANYPLGATKTDTFRDPADQVTRSVTWRIVDRTAGRYQTYRGPSSYVIMLDELVPLKRSGDGVMWHDVASEIVPYSRSWINAFMNSDLNRMVSYGLQSNLDYTTVYSGPGTEAATSGNVVPAMARLFLPSFTELFGYTGSETYGYANAAEGSQFQYYHNLGVSPSSHASLIRYPYNSTSAAGYYWTRSPYGTSGGQAIVEVTQTGANAHEFTDNEEAYIAPCFAW